MLDTKEVLTIGIDYREVRGGIAAVENTYSTFYKPFNHVATAVNGDAPQWRKMLVLLKAVAQFVNWMLFHPEIKIVHVHGASGVSFWRKRIFIRIAKLCGRKVVLHMHGGMFADFSNKHRRAVEKTLSNCDAVIALSEFWKKFFEKDLDFHRVTIVKNVIPAPEVAKKNHDGFVLLFLGLVGPNKGIFDLLEVLDKYRNDFAGKVRLLIGGNGEIQKLKEIINQYGIADLVSYEGWVSGSKKAELMNVSDAYILPSYKEGLPISILEAMSYQLPVISTKVGGIPEIVENGINGYLVNPGDRQAIRDAILKLMENETQRKRMGQISAQRVKEHLPNYVEKQLHDLYESLM